MFGSTVVSTSCADTTVVVLGLILSAVTGTGSVLVVDILDPNVVLFDDTSTISNDVAVLPAALF